MLKDLDDLDQEIVDGMRSEVDRLRGLLATVQAQHGDPNGEDPGCMMTRATYTRIDEELHRSASSPAPRYDSATGRLCPCGAPECFYYNGECNAPCLGPRHVLLDAPAKPSDPSELDVERVAKAIYETTKWRPGEWDEASPFMRDNCRTTARAAIAALRNRASVPR